MRLTGKGSDLPKVTQLKLVKDLSPDLLSPGTQSCKEKSQRTGFLTSLPLPLPVLSSLLFSRYACAKTSAGYQRPRGENIQPLPLVSKDYRRQNTETLVQGAKSC